MSIGACADYISGLSILEDGNVTPYDNTLVTNFHVPLVFVSILLP